VRRGSFCGEHVLADVHQLARVVRGADPARLDEPPKSSTMCFVVNNGMTWTVRIDLHSLRYTASLGSAGPSVMDEDAVLGGFVVTDLPHPY
jgi:hypothetical protein